MTLAYRDQLTLSLRVLFVKVRLYPKKDKRKKARSASLKKLEQARKEHKTKSEKKRFRIGSKKKERSWKLQNVSINDILGTLDISFALIKSVLGTFLGHLKIKVARFNIKVASPDAATTAVAYGAVCGSVSTLLALLEQSDNVKGLRRAKVNIESDFLSETPSADVKISFSIRVWQILHVAFSALLSLIKHRFDSMKKSERSETKTINTTK